MPLRAFWDDAHKGISSNTDIPIDIEALAGFDPKCPRDQAFWKLVPINFRAFGFFEKKNPTVFKKKPLKPGFYMFFLF